MSRMKMRLFLRVDIQYPARAVSGSIPGGNTVVLRLVVGSELPLETDTAPAGDPLLRGPADRAGQTGVTGRIGPRTVPAETAGALSTTEDQNEGVPAPLPEAPRTGDVETVLGIAPETDLAARPTEGSVQLRDINGTEAMARGEMATPEHGTEGATGPSPAAPRPGLRDVV